MSSTSAIVMLVEVLFVSLLSEESKCEVIMCILPLMGKNAKD